MPKNNKQLFNLGQIVATPGALKEMERTKQMPLDFLEKHAFGDWGSMCAEDKRANDEALKNGSRIFSAYILSDSSTRIWVITEADRSSTCLLLPQEY